MPFLKLWHSGRGIHVFEFVQISVGFARSSPYWQYQIVCLLNSCINGILRSIHEGFNKENQYLELLTNHPKSKRKAIYPAFIIRIVKKRLYYEISQKERLDWKVPNVSIRYKNNNCPLKLVACKVELEVLAKD